MLASFIGAVLDLCNDKRTVKYLLRDLLEGDEAGEKEKVSGLFDKLSGPQVPSVSSYSLTDLAKQVRPLRNRTPTGGPLNQFLLRYILSYLFPDSEECSEHPYPELLGELPALAELYTSAKTCPVDGLCWRLATTVGCCVGWAGAAGVAHILHEVCLEVRYRWENGVLIPGVPPGPPDTSTTLLNQKLQMLNCCIARRNSQAGQRNEGQSDSNERNNSDGDDTDCDEFFECEEDEEEEENRNQSTLPAWETAEGREERVGQLRLINDQDWLYRPVLQEPAPLTEDQLAEQAEILMQLGSDQAGSEVRAKLQSAQLLSDMESFKAANPACSLEDFVRWHSPRDWEEGTGLSGRMKLPGNMWTELWDQVSLPVVRCGKLLLSKRTEISLVS